MKPRVVVVVEGGLVQQILADQPVDVVVRDYDEEEQERSFPVELNPKEVFDVWMGLKDG